MSYLSKSLYLITVLYTILPWHKTYSNNSQSLAMDQLEINKVTYNGNTQLHVASEYNCVGIVRVLIKTPGILVNKKKDWMDSTLFGSKQWSPRNCRSANGMFRCSSY